MPPRCLSWSGMIANAKYFVRDATHAVVPLMSRVTSSFGFVASISVSSPPEYAYAIAKFDSSTLFRSA